MADKTIKDKRLFSNQTTTTFAAMYLFASQKPVDGRVVVNEENDLFVLSGDDITEERSNSIDFSIPYDKNESVIVVHTPQHAIERIGDSTGALSRFLPGATTATTTKTPALPRIMKMESLESRTVPNGKNMLFSRCKSNRQPKLTT